ncbi:MAG: hypothetical protein ACI4NO_01240 [Oxalobacter sp.]
MEDKSADSYIMEANKAALVQVALDAAKSIGKTPSEQNGFLMAVSAELVARALAYQSADRREPIMQMFHEAVLAEAVEQENKWFPSD